MTFDIDKAVAANASKLGLRGLPLRTQQYFAALIYNHQVREAVPADGMYGPLTEQIRNALLRDAFAVSAVMPPEPEPEDFSGPTIKLPGCVTGLRVDDVEKRWAAAAQLAIVYVLGGGGKDPHKVDPRSTITKNGTPQFGCDCSAGAAHANGLTKLLKTFPHYGGYQNTDAIIADARGPQVLYEPCAVQRGALLVFSGIDFDHDGDRERIGHVAWVNRVLPGFDPARPDYRLVEIYDCAGSNSKLPGSKGDIALHVAGYFNGKGTYKGETDPRWATIAVWCKAIAR